MRHRLCAGKLAGRGAGCRHGNLAMSPRVPIWPLDAGRSGSASCGYPNQSGDVADVTRLPTLIQTQQAYFLHRAHSNSRHKFCHHHDNCDLHRALNGDDVKEFSHHPLNSHVVRIRLLQLEANA